MQKSVLEQLLLELRFVEAVPAGDKPLGTFGNVLDGLKLSRPYPRTPARTRRYRLPYLGPGELHALGVRDGPGELWAAFDRLGRHREGDLAARQATHARIEHLIREWAPPRFARFDLLLATPAPLPQCAITFLEALRLIAMPKPAAHDADQDPVEHEAQGWLGRGWLPKGYFYDITPEVVISMRQDGSEPNDLFRRHFFLFYAHVLLNVLIAKGQDPGELLAWSDGSRVPTRIDDPTDEMLWNQAWMYFGSWRFRTLAGLDADGSLSIDGLHTLNSKLRGGAPPGRPARLRLTARPASYELPSTFAALLQLNPVLFGSEQQLGREPHLLEALSGPERFSIASTVCAPSFAGRGARVHPDERVQSARPSHSALALASLCALLERWIMAPTSHEQEGSRTAQADLSDFPSDVLAQGRALLTQALVSASGAQAAAPVPDGDSPGDRFYQSPVQAAAGTSGLPFTYTSVPNGWTIDFPEGRWRPFSCAQQRTDDAVAALGALWLPLPNALRRLPVDVEVFALRKVAPEGPAGLESLAFSLTDAIEPAEGTAYWLDPDDQDDPNIPGSVTSGTSIVRALACRMGRQDNARLMVLIGIADPVR